MNEKQPFIHTTVDSKPNVVNEFINDFGSVMFNVGNTIKNGFNNILEFTGLDSVARFLSDGFKALKDGVKNSPLGQWAKNTFSLDGKNEETQLTMSSVPKSNMSIVENIQNKKDLLFDNIATLGKMAKENVNENVSKLGDLLSKPNNDANANIVDINKINEIKVSQNEDTEQKLKSITSIKNNLF